MASVNGGKKGKNDYMNSFMSFLENENGGNETNANNGKNGSSAEDSNSSHVDEDKNERQPEEQEQQEEEQTNTNNTEQEPTNTNNTEQEQESSNSNSSSDASSKRKRNVAKRGGSTPKPADRSTLRRATRNVKRYSYNEEYVDDPDEPDYVMTSGDAQDSDDDPDFAPVKKNNTSPDFSKKFNRSRRGFVARNSSQIKRNLSEDTNIPRKKGRPSSVKPTTTTPSYTTTDNSNNSENSNSMDDSNASDSTVKSEANKRWNQPLLLPEGPELNSEQMEMVESQFKSGDFVMAKKDCDMMEHPPIWRIDGKSLLQKFQMFEKNDKKYYRNISTYSGWTPPAKALYIPVKVNFTFQSRYDTVVELVGFRDSETSSKPTVSEDVPEKVPAWAAQSNQDFEISEDLKLHMPSFEIYLQTLISQALDHNFLKEIYQENDAYFVDRVKIIDDLTDERKSKVLEIVEWSQSFQDSLNTWPCMNIMQTKNTDKCQACQKENTTKLSQFYGQPYHHQTLQSREPEEAQKDNKNFEICERCSALSHLYSKICHQKYDYYSQCKSTVTNMRVTNPSKITTAILRDLLANDHWITGLFRSMCTTWIRVDRIHREEMKERGQQNEDS